MQTRRATALGLGAAGLVLALAGCGGEPASFEEAGEDVVQGYAVDPDPATRTTNVNVRLAEPGKESEDPAAVGYYDVRRQAYAYRVECKTDDGVTWARATVPVRPSDGLDLRVTARSDRPGEATAEFAGHTAPLSVPDGEGGVPAVAWYGPGDVRVDAQTAVQQQWADQTTGAPLLADVSLRMVCQSGLG